MVRSPGPVCAGFGLDDGEVLSHLAVVAIGYLVKGIINRQWFIVNLAEYRRGKLLALDDFEYTPQYLPVL